MKGKKRGSDVTAEKHDTTLEQEMDDEFMSERNMKRRQGKERKRQDAEDYVGTQMSSHILQEARQQQLEMENERDEERGVAAARRAFSAAAEAAVLRKQAADAHDSEEEEEDEEAGRFSDTESQYDVFIEEEITEEDERAVALFMSSEPAPQRTLADLIMAKIRDKEEEAGIAPGGDEGERTIPGLDNKVMEVYRGVGKLLSRYTAGKVPKAFKIIPSLSNWEEILYLTEPEQWSPAAVYVATRLFASNLNAKMAQRFYHLVLLPRIRNDILVNKRLHFALYQALKKALYKPSAFYKGFLLPLCQSGTCSLREAVIVGSVLQKVSVPVLHSSVALLKLAEMEYAGTTSYFLKLLMDKKYALPYRVVDALLDHFVRFQQEERELPVIWHQSLLTFVQRYKNEVKEEDQEKLKRLMRQQRHYLVTPEVQRELQHSHPRGKGGKPGAVFGPPAGVVKGAMEEDFRSLPDVSIGMDED